jgi:hypothetical protein
MANDSAASVGAGGLRLKREERISMEKERLVIGERKVTVDYDFLNESDKDITTEVAFPVPPYANEPENTGGPREFRDFRVWAGQFPVVYQTEVKALKNGNDYTNILREMGVDIESFGLYLNTHVGVSAVDQIDQLSEADKRKLADLGLTDSNGWADWQVSKTYHWTMTFPAHKLLHVRHEYTPAWGWSDTMLHDLDPEARKRDAQTARKRGDGISDDDTADASWRSTYIDNACVDESLRKKVTNDLAVPAEGGRRAPDDANFVFEWVDYILTTANNWKGPIKDFELVVDRPAAEPAKSKWYVSFCWDGPVDRSSPEHFVARATNFVPKKELHVAFLRVDLPKSN